MPDQRDLDPAETREWLDAIDSVLEADGGERAHYLLERMVDRLRRSGVHLPYRATTAYVNTIRKSDEKPFAGDRALERRLRSINRWNALAMVVRANKLHDGIGGHIASYQSAATLIETAFNHFLRAAGDDAGGDVVFFQGHSAPGVYARAFLEGRLSKEQLDRFRQEVGGGGLSSYPHPRLMPEFWQFPTVSMGLSPIMGIYQARFMKYLAARGLADTAGRRVWVFCGDGEMDEPESLGAISLAAREELDNLIFVVNCNLQRLDGPVRGNGKIIQELEGTFRGSGWRVLKVIWGDGWDPLLARDKNGTLLQRMEEAVDGDYQAYKAKGGAYVRKHFFGKVPELAEMVAGMTDDQIWALNRGGHDPQKVFAAYAAACESDGRPVVVLAKTVKGYGLGPTGQSVNIAHQLKKPPREALAAFRDRYRIPIPDERLDEVPYYQPDPDSAEMQYLRECRAALGGPMPGRGATAASLSIPDFAIFDSQTKATGDRKISTTMAFVRVLTALTRDKTLGPRVVPIVADEARTFGMEGLFRTLGIYAAKGQLYEPVDADEVMYYREDAGGQILQEGISEAGALSSWIAAATAYATHRVQMIPFFIFYSMFGFQRVGDLAWAAADSRARGFLLGGTSGRTTLAGEGLQHQDGHSHLLASTIPCCRAYDATYHYEVAAIVHAGLKAMHEEQVDAFYYLTLLNENYEHPAMPEGSYDAIVRGMYRLEAAGDGPARVRLLASGAILREAIAAREMLREDWKVEADLFAVTSFTELRRAGLACDREALLRPAEEAPVPYVATLLGDSAAPVIAASDYMRAYADQIRTWVPARYAVLGTDGFGLSDTRENLRAHFEVDRRYIALAALKALADEGTVAASVVGEAIARYRIDAAKPDPAKV